VDIGSLADIESLMDIESLIKVDSFIRQRKLKSCSASLRILVLNYIFILGFKLQPNLIASCASLGPEVFFPFGGRAYSFTTVVLI